MLFDVILFASSHYDIYGLPKTEKECLLLLQLASQKNATYKREEYPTFVRLILRKL